MSEIVHADCLDLERGLPALADDSVDHAIFDAPYSEHTHRAGRRGCTGYTEPSRPRSTRAQFNRTRDLGFEHLSPELRHGVAFQCSRVVRRWTLAFTDHEGGQAWKDDLEAAGLEVVRFGVWIKLGATPQFTGDRPAQGHEVIVIAHRPGRKRWNGGGRHAVWTCPIVLNRSGEDPRIHTTQKPLELMEALVRDFTDPGDLVIDPFAGSGTTLVACKRLGRVSRGWEMQEKYAIAAQVRLDGIREQVDLFERAKRGKDEQRDLFAKEATDGVES